MKEEEEESGGKEKSRPYFPAFGRRAQKMELSLCHACNELLLIKQLFSFCTSRGYSSLLEEPRVFLAQITNRHVSSFSFEKSRQRREFRWLPRGKRTSSIKSKKKGRDTEETDARLFSFLTGVRAKRLSSYVSRVAPSTNYIS